MTIRALALALVSSVFISPALAADLPTANADIYTPTAVQGTYFHGAYIGVTGGFGAANNELNADKERRWVREDGELYRDDLDADIGSGLGLFGVNAGYDFRVGKFVFGPTIRYNWLTGSGDIKDTEIFGWSSATSVDYNNEFGVGGRLGLMVSDKTLVYTGLLYTQLEAGHSYSDQDGLIGKRDVTFNGYTILAGIETMITPQLSLKLEGEYAQYGKESFTIGERSITAQPDIYDVKIGLTYRPNSAIDSLK